MQFDIQSTFIAIGAVFIVGILLDAWRRGRKANRLEHKMDEIIHETLENNPFTRDYSEEEPVATAPKQPKRQILKTEVVAICVMAKKSSEQKLKNFSGSVLFAALRRMRLYHGKNEVFHRHEAGKTSGTAIFSVASLTEPGYFRLSEMTAKTFPGIVLYLNVHELDNLSKGFEELVETAYHLAEILGGIVCDMKRHPLTYQQIEDMRKKVKSLEMEDTLEDEPQSYQTSYREELEIEPS